MGEAHFILYSEQAFGGQSYSERKPSAAHGAGELLADGGIDLDKIGNDGDASADLPVGLVAVVSEGFRNQQKPRACLEFTADTPGHVVVAAGTVSQPPDIGMHNKPVAIE